MTHRDFDSQFDNLAEYWWQIDGPFNILHKITPIRVQYIKNILNAPLSGLDILDLGCGGGLLSEPLCRLGGNVTAVDVSHKNITAAREHASLQGLSINYVHASALEFITQDQNQQKFDVVIIFEILEHVDDFGYILRSATNLLKNKSKSKLIISTIARTTKSLILAKFMAENVLGWVPKGIHSHDKFINPSEIAKILAAEGVAVSDLSGLSFDVMKAKWWLSKDASVNYFMAT